MEDLTGDPLWCKQTRFILSLLTPSDLLRARRVLELAKQDWFEIGKDGRQFSKVFVEETKMSLAEVSELIDFIDRELAKRRESSDKERSSV